MRIAVLCTDLGVRVPDESKGAAIHLLAIAKAFAGIGNDVMLVGVAGHGAAPAEVDTFLLPHPGRSEGLERERRKLAFVRHTIEEAAGPLKAFRPDAVYERLSLFGLAGRALADLLEVPHALEANALIAQEEAEWRGLQLRSLACRREQLVLERADVCFAVSDELRTQLLRSVPGARVVVVPNGVDTSRFERLPDRREARRLAGLPLDSRVIVFVGSLRPWHGLELGIQALRRLPDEVLLAVAGDGHERARLTRVSEQLGVAGRVRWLGQRPHDEVPGVLAAADVAIAPYPASNGFSFSPLKLYEYLAAGVPTVASDVGQVRAALDGGAYGALVPPGDVEALAQAIRAAFGPRARTTAAQAREHALRAHAWDGRAREIVTELERARDRRTAYALAR